MLKILLLFCILAIPGGSFGLNDTCSSDDLNHSLLVECKTSGCDTEDWSQIWPATQDQVVHMYSSRPGDRFSVETLTNLRYVETPHQRLLDINTTLRVSTEPTSKTEWNGFGTTIDLSTFFQPGDDSEVERIHGPILRDLFSDSGLGFSLLKLSLGQDVVLQNNASHMLIRFDNIMHKIGIDRKVKVILSLGDLEKSFDTIEALKAISITMNELPMLKCWAVGISLDWYSEGMLGFVQELFSTKNVLVATDLKQALAICGNNLEHRNAEVGLIIALKYSTPYNIIGRISEKIKKVVYISGDGHLRKDFGDWQNAQNYANQIRIQFLYSSFGFIEESSLTEDKSQGSKDNIDRPIYNFRKSFGIHFRGPMYYAIGHFSRYIPPGSSLASFEVDTQPNMFAAQYSAFITSNGFVVSVILNDNEHLLPFNLEIDGAIVANINLKPKSFNTIVYKMM